MFSLRRRLNNPVSWMLYMFSFILFGALMFADVLLTAVAPALVLPTSIYMSPGIYSEVGDYLPSNFVYQSDKSIADIQIQLIDDGYSVIGDFSIEQQQQISQLIHGYHRLSMVEKMPDTMVAMFDQMMIANIVWESEADQPANHSGFFVITSIYFMLLSFSTAVANEVVNEKTSNVIEIILTSISHKEHYYSKLLIGWFTMLSQLLIHSFGFIFWFVMRTIFDNGTKMMNVLYRMRWLPVQYISFEDWFYSMNIGLSQLSIIILCAIFLMLGILLVQLLMVLLSVHINSIEEAAAIQGPFYIGMLVIYYMAIFINSFEQLNQGWGYYFSYVPILSMLFMPSRLLNTYVSSSELLLAFLIALLTLLICLKFGKEHYRKNLLKGCTKRPYVKNET